MVEKYIQKEKMNVPMHKSKISSHSLTKIIDKMATITVINKALSSANVLGEVFLEFIMDTAEAIYLLNKEGFTDMCLRLLIYLNTIMKNRNFLPRLM